MRLFLTGALLLCAAVMVVSGQQPQQLQKSQQLSNGHTSSEESVKDSSPAAAGNVQYRARPSYSSAQYSSEEEEEDPQPVYTRRQHHPQQQEKKSKKVAYSSEELEVEEEPDRLSLLLEKSDFHCSGRTTGYYADESLGCEVFHYCQENQKHSWICPEGFTFHQVHLICMPPSSDNICDQSSKYHFVNDYLYKPINMEEHMSKPNVTLRYSERYYPENFYVDERNYDYERQQRIHEDRRTPVQQAPPKQQQYHYVPQQQTIRKQPVYQGPTTPSSHRIVSPASPTHQSNVFRSPEEINISLQQRRPTYTPTTQRYEDEDEYGSYERK